MAICKAIEHYLSNYYSKEEPDTVNIYSDSAYCINIFTSWAKSWERNNWTRGKKHEPIVNLSLIQTIWNYCKMLNSGFRTINFIKVKGHSTDKFNIFVDKLAVEAKEKLLNNEVSNNE